MDRFPNRLFSSRIVMLEGHLGGRRDEEDAEEPPTNK